MAIQNLLPANFAYVILTFFYSWVMLAYLGVKVGQARKKYDVKDIPEQQDAYIVTIISHSKNSLYVSQTAQFTDTDKGLVFSGNAMQWFCIELTGSQFHWQNDNPNSITAA
ncbi:hypothetical protein EOD39_20934 [Acipenser ruthenus]|uniref:Uncharacterized protein n=1 Tax=Acipenser ruthenus TaxID=7906 RepID=A0A444UU71_ACIRT|nr:hypothetical protein EOD39_20934 [Acipenser ruthenus]